jgi:transposase
VTDLTEAQWAALEPLLPPPPAPHRGGRPRLRSRRELIDGIRWRFQTRARWDKLPQRYGPYQTTYALYRAWQKDGTWTRLVQAMGGTAEAKSIIPWAQAGSASAASRDEAKWQGERKVF